MHISQIISRVHGDLKRLRFRAHFLSHNLKKRLVSALIFPHFDYCCLAFCDLPGYLNLKLQRFQNHLIRFIFRLRKDNALEPFAKRLNWLSISDRRKYFMFIFSIRFSQLKDLAISFRCFPNQRLIYGGQIARLRLLLRLRLICLPHQLSHLKIRSVIRL